MAEHLLVLTTLGNDEDAVRVAKALLERRVAACVNIVGSVRSFYRWEGKIEDDSERLLLIKTRADRYNDLESVIGDVHPYDVPELIAVPLERGAAAYLGWVDDETIARREPGDSAGA
jgi:periplasmic divalent cation tolerance protein